MIEHTTSPQEYSISFVSSEVEPFSKTGGLGDVAGQLPFELQASVKNIHIITPLYGTISTRDWNIELEKDFGMVEVAEETYASFQIYRTEYEGLTVYFVDSPEYFSDVNQMYLDNTTSARNNARFLIFSLGALLFLADFEEKPDIIHCNDWHTGLIPELVEREYNGFDFHNTFADTKTLFTIHNLYFQSGTHEDAITANDNGHSQLPLLTESDELKNINFAKRGIIHSDAVNAVSPRYAQEIMMPKFGEELHVILKNRKYKVFGILNGIDNNEFNPATDPGLNKQYDGDNSAYKEANKRYIQQQFGLTEGSRIPVIAMVTRITEQKGIDLIKNILPYLLERNVEFIILGGGEQHYEDFFTEIEAKNSERMYAQFEFNAMWETQILAGADVFLMPSRFEPAGLGQLKSLRYGCIPIVHAVGGLMDSIVNISPLQKTGNGFVFYSYNSYELYGAIIRALEYYKDRNSWYELVARSMHQTFSWEIPGKQYVELYRNMIENRIQPIDE